MTTPPPDEVPTRTRFADPRPPVPAAGEPPTSAPVEPVAAEPVTGELPATAPATAPDAPADPPAADAAAAEPVASDAAAAEPVAEHLTGEPVGEAAPPAVHEQVGQAAAPVVHEQVAEAAAPEVHEQVVEPPVAVEATAVGATAAEFSPPAPYEPPATARSAASMQDDADVPTPSTGRGLLPVLAGLVVVLAALTAYLGYLAADTRGTAPVERERRQALSAARSASRSIFSYDYRHLDRDFAAGRAVTTGPFRSEYDKTTKKLVDDVAGRYKAVVVADVSAAAVENVSGDRVTVLVFVNQQSSSTVMTTPKITQSRLEMTLLRRGGHWLVERVKAL